MLGLAMCLDLEPTTRNLPLPSEIGDNQNNRVKKLILNIGSF